MRTFLFTLIIFSSINTFSQYGRIKGVLINRYENKPLSFANIILINNNQGTITDSNGEFLLDSLREGIYTIKINYAGFRDSIISNITVKNAQSSTLTIYYPAPCRFDSNRNNKTCPICNKSNKVLPISYGLPVFTDKYGNDIQNRRKRNATIRRFEKERYFGGCEITGCDPNWYCKRCKYKF